jgi:hypothetical protein
VERTWKNLILFWSSTMKPSEITQLLIALQVWSEHKDPTVKAWANTIRQNLRRLKKNPNDKELLVQMEKNIKALRKTLAS